MTATPTMMRAPSSADERTATAYHESGHGVIGVELGIAISHVRLFGAEQPGRRKGFALINGHHLSDAEVDRAALDDSTDDLPTLASVPSRLVEHLIMLLAGAASEARYVGYQGDGGWRDRLCAEVLVGEALRKPPYGRAVHDYLQIIDAVTTDHVRRRWDWITRVADELVARGALSGDDVQRLRNR